MPMPLRGSLARVSDSLSASRVAAAILADVPAHLVADTLASEASRIAGAPVALYVPDIDGSCLRRLAGSSELPERLEFSGAIGPEIPEERFGELEQAVRSQLLGSVALPLPVYGRTVAVFVVRRAPQLPLEEIASEGAIALEIASRYTDVFESARRGRRPTAAAEAQHDMLPPRVARVEGAQLAATVLPAYDVGGDWYDDAENRDGTWIALADAVARERNRRPFQRSRSARCARRGALGRRSRARRSRCTRRSTTWPKRQLS